MDAIKAVSRLGFGGQDKLVLEFEDPRRGRLFGRDESLGVTPRGLGESAKRLFRSGFSAGFGGGFGVWGDRRWAEKRLLDEDAG